MSPFNAPHRPRWQRAALPALLALSLLSGGCAVVSVAGAVAGTAVSVAGTVVTTAAKVTGKVVEKTVDAITPDGK